MFLFFFVEPAAFLTVFLSAAFHISAEGSCERRREKVKWGPCGARATSGVGTPERGKETE